jgi:hypothetical protein
MMMHANPQLDEERLVALYQQATSGDDPDKVEMGLIEGELRKAGMELKRKPGVSAIGDGVGTQDDIKAAGLALKLFAKPVEQSVEQHAQKFASSWKRYSLAQRATDILKDLETLKEGVEVEPER